MVIAVFTFHQISSFSKQTLLSILVMALFLWGGVQYLKRKADNLQEQQKNDRTFLDKEGAWRKEVESNRADVATFPRKGFRFLKQNQTFMDIAKMVVICRMFDRARFSELLLYLDRCQKVYMYILDGRFSPTTHVPHFLDVREQVLSTLYSMYFAVPERLKHVYGVAPYEQLSKAIDRFLSISEEMLEVLRSYTNKTAKIPYFPPSSPSPADQPFDPIKSRILP
jgi:hypothetical protein